MATQADHIQATIAQMQQAVAEQRRVLAEMEEQDASAYGLSDEQLEEVRRRRQGFREGTERYATDEEIAALWKKWGL